MNLLTLTPFYKPIPDAISRALDGTCYVVRGCTPSAAGLGLRVNVAAGDSVEGSVPHFEYAGGNVTLSAASSVASLLYRRDLVYRDSAGTLTVAAGTPALLTSTTPVAPALPANATLLAICFIAPGQTLLGANDVEDCRQVRSDALRPFTQATLPSTPTAGDLVRLTDFDRSVWLRDGTLWRSLNNRRFDARAFEAVGDGVADDTTPLQNAINAADAAGGGIVDLGPGTFLITAALTLPVAVWLRGAGQLGANRVTGKITSISVKTDIAAINSVFAINSSIAVNQKITDLAIIQTGVAAPTHEGINQVGGTFVLLHNVSVVGFKWGIVFDQTELAEIDLCDIEGCSTAGVWLANGPDHTPGGGGQFTNRISITRCQINGTGIGIADDGGTAHAFAYNNFNGCTTQIRAAGLNVLTIGPGNEFESASTRVMKFANTTFTLGNGVGQCKTVNIFGNQISAGAGGATDALNFDNGDPVSIFGNQFSSSVTCIVGLSLLGQFTHFGNTNSDVGALTDGGTPSIAHIDMDAFTTVAPQVASAAPNGLTVAASTTTYSQIIGAGNLNGTENIKQQVMTQAGRCKKLYVVTNTAQPAGGTLVVTVRKNGVNTALTLTIAAGAGAGTFTDLTHSFTFVAGDLLSIGVVNNDGANPSAGLNSLAVTLAW